jgi:hypothetical protein
MARVLGVKINGLFLGKKECPPATYRQSTADPLLPTEHGFLSPCLPRNMLKKTPTDFLVNSVRLQPGSGQPPITDHRRKNLPGYR